MRSRFSQHGVRSRATSSSFPSSRGRSTPPVPRSMPSFRSPRPHSPACRSATSPTGITSGCAMTPQFNFMVVAPLKAGVDTSLAALLASMNSAPGTVDPQNTLVPFGRLDRLHFARFVILRAPGGDDISVYGLPSSAFPVSLAFLGDYDGPEESFLPELVALAGPGLRQVFSYCEGFASDGDLLEWMGRHAAKPSAAYVNWIGRTVREIREDDDLRLALQQEWER